MPRPMNTMELSFSERGRSLVDSLSGLGRSRRRESTFTNLIGRKPAETATESSGER